MLYFRFGPLRYPFIDHIFSILAKEIFWATLATLATLATRIDETTREAMAFLKLKKRLKPLGKHGRFSLGIVGNS